LKVDGDLSDPIWKDALRIERFYDVRTSSNTEPLVRTVIWIGYDSQFLYVAARNEDPAPQNIRAPLVPRDRVFGEQDFIQFDIDAQDDGKSSTIFRVNARNVQTDGTYTESSEVDDYSPDFDYETATKILSDAWQAEMRIPLTSLRYANRDPQTWRIVFYRVYPRDQRYRFRTFPTVKGQSCWLCNAPRYEGVTGISSAGTLVTTPFLTTRAVAPPHTATRREVDGGLDAKWLASPAFTVDATFRPDFSQVEADVTEISVNRQFAIFYPEKRPFFMEGADLLSSPIQAIHTRTITSPSWGARVTGRPGNHAFTIVAAGDRGGGSTIVPGPVFSSYADQPRALTILGRYRYSIGASSAGLLLTSRSANDAANTVIGPDFMWWLSSSHRITGQFLVSRTKDPHAPRQQGHAALLSWSDQSTHWRAGATAQDIDRGFRADSGFIPQTGVRALQGTIVGVAYPKKLFTSFEGGVVAERVSEKNGDVVSAAFYPRIAFEGWRGTVGEVAIHPNEKLRAANGLVRSHDYLTVALRFLPSRRVPFLNLSLRAGDEVDLSSARVGKGQQLTAFVRMQPAPPLYAEVTGSVHHLSAGDALLFRANALSTRLTWAFTPRSFAKLVTDAQRITFGGGAKSGFLSATILYAYQLTWQTSFYAGYGDARDVDDFGHLGQPRKEFFVKASYAIRTVIGGL
jgi:hypothetical protein